MATLYSPLKLFSQFCLQTYLINEISLLYKHLLLVAGIVSCICKCFRVMENDLQHIEIAACSFWTAGNHVCRFFGLMLRFFCFLRENSCVWRSGSFGEVVWKVCFTYVSIWPFYVKWPSYFMKLAVTMATPNNSFNSEPSRSTAVDILKSYVGTTESTLFLCIWDVSLFQKSILGSLLF